MHEVDCVYVLEPQGDLFQDSESDLMERAVLELARDGRKIVVDLSGVHHLTARGLGILAHGQVVASDRGGFIVLCHPRRSHRWLLDKTGLSTAFAMAETIEAAMSRLGNGHRAIAVA
jgi:anti-anti-sigma factor